MSIFNNMYSFKYGEVMPNLLYRIDTDIPKTGFAYLKNAIISSGGITNFPALEKISSLNIANIKAIRTFKYKINKKNTALTGLLFVFTDIDLYILRQDNFQQIKVISSDYMIDEIDNKLSITQFDNSVIICCENKKPFMVRVNESNLTFEVVNYWESITNPPVKGVTSDYYYTGDDRVVFEWFKEGTKIIFRSLANKIYTTEFMNGLNKGRISIFGGEFYIESIANTEGAQQFTTTQMIAPELDIPTPSTPADDRKINILDIRFSENLFKDNGFPAVCCYYLGRLIFGNVGGNPSAVVSSRVNDSLNFRSSLKDDDGFTSFIPDNELNEVKALIPHKSLLVMTDKGIYSTLLNTVLTPSESMLFQIPVSAPRGTTESYIKQHGALYYIDKSDRIIRIDDVGEDNSYKTLDISIYSQHLTKKAKKLFATEFKSNNFIGVDTGLETNVYIHNSQSGITAWTRTNKKEGITEYTEINNSLHSFNITPSAIDIYKYSDSIVEPIELKIPYVSLDTGYNQIPSFNIKTSIGRVIINCFGEYHFQVGKQKIEAPFNNDIKENYYNLRKIEIPNLGGDELHVKQLNDEKIEILSLSIEIKNLKEVK